MLEVISRNHEVLSWFTHPQVLILERVQLTERYGISDENGKA
ncbi:MAG: hypothetical protein ACLP05_09685 [Candidatus Kryptoniota bacterium]